MDNKMSDDIDLIEIIKKLYDSRKRIIVITISFILIGITTSLLLPIKYTSSTVFITQNQEASGSPLSGVASLVGINLGGVNYGGEILSSMYPKVAESPKFKRLLLSEKIDDKNNITFKEHLINHYNLEKEENIKSSKYFVSKLEEDCFKLIRNILSINVNQKDGFITISASMSNAEYSAIVANLAKEILQKIIIDNRIESAKQNLMFSEKQLSEKKLIFDEIQAKLTYFSDTNLNSVNSTIINEQTKLKAEFEIINAVVTELSKQVEQAKLQVNKDTPVFSTIKEAVIPNIRTSPKRKQIVLYSTFIGLFFSSFLILFKDFAFDIYRKIVYSKK